MDDQNDPNLLNAKQYVPAGQASIDEAWHKEQFRRSFDTIRVKNPTDKEFFVEWDHRYHRVPAMVLPMSPVLSPQPIVVI